MAIPNKPPIDNTANSEAPVAVDLTSVAPAEVTETPAETPAEAPVEAPVEAPAEVTETPDAINTTPNLSLDEYNRLAVVTLSDEFHVDDAALQGAAVVIIDRFLEAGRQLDLLKKVLYYGKAPETLGKSYIDYIKNDVLSETTPLQQRLLHGAIGISTESVEILEQVYAHVTSKGTKELDVVNLGEELGDVAWYQAIFLRDLTLDYYSILTINIKKLAARFGDKFSAFRAENRDLKTERGILEA